ncbi:MAG: TIM-barrel domain-containing protein [Angustibacter sp.]
MQSRVARCESGLFKWHARAVRPSARVVTVLVVGISMVVGLGAAALWGLPMLRRQLIASNLDPGLIEVAPGMRGSVSLGNAVYVRLDAGGLVLQRQATEIWRSVNNGSPVTAGVGTLAWRGGSGTGEVLAADERISGSMGNLRITERTLTSRRVVYRGRVFADQPTGPASRPISITITRRSRDSRVLIDVQVPGADVVVLHGYRRRDFSFSGLGTQRAGHPLTDERYPVLPRSFDPGDSGQDDPLVRQAVAPILQTGSTSALAVSPPGYTVVDLRREGRADVRVWGDRILGRVYDGTWAQVRFQHSADVGRPPPLPIWAASGAVVGVRGSSSAVRSAVQRLQRADAALAAVLVRDGGQRARYPDWRDLVDRLAASDVRVLTSVSPSLAVRSRPAGPRDEQQLLATARRRGWVVTGSDGRPVRVAVADPDAGTVPAELIDLADSQAVEWYTGVLADRMRAERISGWVAHGGDEYPPAVDPPVAGGGTGFRGGDSSGEHRHATWPSRWAGVLRDACRRAGRPDCLLLPDTADERTVTHAGVVSTGRERSGWGTEGLAGAFAATLNAGDSGLALVHSPVGGVAGSSSWWGRDQRRSDELLERWTELAVFGPVLRTDEGDRPSEQPQVWSSPGRVAQFARMTRVFAALADYRRATARQATQDGLPMVRPVRSADGGVWQQGDDSDLAFAFGDSAVVVPVVRPGQTSVEAVLPPGRWKELLTGQVHQVVARRSPTPSPVGSSTRRADAITIAAPVGQPVVLVRDDNPDGNRLRNALRSAGLVR